MDIAGSDFSVAAHSNGGRKGLAAGSGAAVQHIPLGILGQLRAQNAELCRRVLNVEQAFLERGQMLQTAGVGKDQAVCQPAMRTHRYVFFLQSGSQIVCSDLQGIHLNHRIGGGIVGFQHSFQPLFPHIAAQQRNQVCRMAVTVLQRGGFFQRTLCAYRISQHRIDQSRSIFLLRAVFFCQRHGFIYRRAFRNLVQFIDLIQSQVQDIPHHRMQIPQLACQQLFQIKVQLLPVLQHTIAKMGRQPSIPAIQPIPLDVIFQHTIGPGTVFPAGNQRIERCLSRTHGVYRGWPRK